MLSTRGDFSKRKRSLPILTGFTATFPSIFPFLLGMCFARANHFFISSFNFLSLEGRHRSRSQPQNCSNLLLRKAEISRRFWSLIDARLTPGRGYRFNQRLEAWRPPGEAQITLVATETVPNSDFWIPERTASGGAGKPAGTISETDWATVSSPVPGRWSPIGLRIQTLLALCGN